MTAQIPDVFRFNGEEYSLVGMNGEGLFEPEDFEMIPMMASTACYRGYVMTYDCVDRVMILDEMLIRTDQVVPINGVAPMQFDTGKFRIFSHRYEKLRLKTRFTGSLLLGKDFIDSLYVHMGFQKATAFRTVIEVQIQDGDIISICDLSDKIEELRVWGRTSTRKHTDDQDNWIEESFSLDYEL